MDAVTVLLFFFAIVALYWNRERSTLVNRINVIPGPSSTLPILGNLLDLPRNGHDLLQTLCVKWVKEYGPVYRIWRGMKPMVILSSPQAVEAILSSPKHINKSAISEFFVPWLGRGLLLSNGEKWKEDRRLLTPAFHFQILYDFFDVFNRNTEIWIEQIKKKLQHEKEIEIFSMASRCTLDIICETAMGLSIDAQQESENQYTDSTDQLEQMMQERMNSALSLLPNWMYFRFTSHGRQVQRHIDVVHSFTAKVLKERKERMNQSESLESSEPKKRRPFLDLLLDTTRAGSKLSDNDIISQVDTFMFAGHDTTSTVITWFLYCMATHHDIQDKVYQEIYDCFGDSDRPCVLDDLPKLKYLECCMKETMRRHPSVPVIRRLIKEEVNIHGYTIPSDTTVQVQMYAAHHDGEYFQDPETFNPERFLPEQSVGRHPYSFAPFSAGPRNCIGQKFAMYEGKVILANLLRQFRFDIDPRRLPVRECLQFILKPENGMHLIVIPRT